MLGTTALSYRRLSVLLRHAPLGSAYARAVLGEAGEWGLGDHLLAGIWDQLAVANWQRGGKGSRPKPLPRPEASAEKPKLTVAELDKRLGRE